MKRESHVLLAGLLATSILACRHRGVRVVGETLPSAISMNESKMWDPNFDVAAAFVMSPPIRSKWVLAGGRVTAGGGTGSASQTVAP